ncbi:hypothetical protein [Roseibium hamelinense]|uniref:hypothetical protein n=1 Tax=Roseibium hamelinense TaxID=150831 RepID=UPI0012BC5406|nr:hypothetical protein [Roseibium hamelinense]
MVFAEGKTLDPINRSSQLHDEPVILFSDVDPVFQPDNVDERPPTAGEQRMQIVFADAL